MKAGLYTWYTIYKYYSFSKNARLVQNVDSAEARKPQAIVDIHSGHLHIASGQSLINKTIRTRNRQSTGPFSPEDHRKNKNQNSDIRSYQSCQPQQGMCARKPALARERDARKAVSSRQAQDSPHYSSKNFMWDPPIFGHHGVATSRHAKKLSAPTLDRGCLEHEKTAFVIHKTHICNGRCVI